MTAGAVIVQFLAACSEFSDEAPSIMAGLQWDLQVLDSVRDYFHTRKAMDANRHLPPETQALFERTSRYLDGFADKVQQSFRKIERKGLLRTTINRTMWIARRSELQKMQREIFEWTQRFGVRALGLPVELRVLIPISNEGNNKAVTPVVVKSNSKLQEFLALASSTKQQRSRAMLMEESRELASGVISSPNQPMDYFGEQLIFSSRMIPGSVSPASHEFKTLTFEMGELAAALSCLEPTPDIRILKVEFYFYNASNHQFVFAHIPPYRVVSMTTLKDFIFHNPFPATGAALNQCFKLAYKLAEAVFFLHTAGFLHKNITSSSVALLRREDPPHSVVHSITINEAYLMGFDLIRESESITYLDGSSKRNNKELRPIWEVDVFQHPDRLHREVIPRYINTYDVYSLGVVLLEIGFWEPLSRVVPNLDRGDSSGWTRELTKAVPRMGGRMGDRYQRLVKWCLSLTGRQIVKATQFVQEILDPLEEMANALS
ncbi:hypothetical protein GQX73_g4942 [Xylaria multiplex]|uniref:Protein kinase domain-containing protein n=1 Tax=Xylaria multiplex TaxID=323545 RepID=A0A7C8MSY0_9PEZI|nr:hypothetical protein GQX73_g4942 [Xylaria multiplex]